MYTVVVKELIEIVYHHALLIPEIQVYAYTHTVYTKICRHINNNNLKLVCRK